MTGSTLVVINNLLYNIISGFAIVNTIMIELAFFLINQQGIIIKGGDEFSKCGKLGNRCVRGLVCLAFLTTL